MTTTAPELVAEQLLARSTARPHSPAELGAWLAQAAGNTGQDGQDVLRRHLHDTGRALGGAVDELPWRAALDCLLCCEPGATARALLPDPVGLRLTEAAWAGLQASLDGRLAELRQCLPAASWGQLVQRYPALAWLAGTVCAQWARAYGELFARLAADLAMLSVRLWDGEHPGALTGVRGDAGDRHGGGRSVVLLDFEHGRSVVYKPKQLRHAAAFQTLLGHLNAAGLSLPLATRTVLCHGEYGWEERIQPTDCADRAGFDRFYHRLGLLVRLLQLLDGRDMWADNLIAVADQPVLIDLECLLTPSIRPIGAQTLASTLAPVLNATAVTSGLVCKPWSAPQDLPLTDISCLSRAGDLRGPDGQLVLPLPAYRPQLAGTPADAWQYLAQVVAGYREMQGVLAAERAVLADPAGPLSGLRGAWVRYLHRNTWDCYKIARTTVRPAALADGIARETVLAGLIREPLATVGESRPDVLAVSFAEIDAFRRLDVPLLGSRTDSTSVFPAGGPEIPGYFAATAWDRLKIEVNRLASFDLPGQVAVLGSALDAAVGGSEQGGTRSSSARIGARRAARATVPDPVAAALSIGELLLDSRIAGGWIGATWAPLTGLRSVDILGPDLAAGLSGIAVFLAELAAVTGSTRFRHATGQVLRAASGSLNRLGFAEPSQTGAAEARGGFVGPGALLHAMARCGQRLADPELLTAAVDLLPLAVAGQGPAGIDDLAVGTAGLLCNLLRLRAATGGSEPLDNAISDLVGRLVGTPRLARHQHPAAAELLPTGPDGVTLALARAVAEAPELAGPAAAAVVAGHRFADNPGGRLAALDVAQALGRPLSHTGPGQPAAAAAHTIRQLLATADRCLTADRPVESLIAELLRRRANTGRWFGDRLAADRYNPGALDGICAVGLLLLRSRCPDVKTLTTLR